MSKILPFEDPESGPDYRRMARAIRYLAENYQDQPRLEDAAAAACLSSFHFQRLFTRYVGVSPKSFVGHLTLEHAKRELAKGASVLDAALDAGLSGPSRLHDLALKIEAMTPGEYAKAGAGLAVDYGFHASPFGIALIAMTARGVCGLGFGDEDEETAMLEDMKSRWPKARFVENTARTAPVARHVFGMETPKAPLGLHLLGTPWQIKVWQALLAIPPGKVTSYRAIAARVSDAKASRAVGTAVGRNPISLLIPCHRVLGSDGALHGYHWGLARKRALLAIEACRSDSQSERPRTSAML
jgi:AraC family transcriptional regulator of adaptative response/methylated-DNA-[protein]-cysteine methyltransferase